MRIIEVTTNSVVAELEEIAAAIKKNCGPYLKALGGEISKYKLYRGLAGESFNMDDILMLKCPVNRQPHDVPIIVHNISDQYFLKQSGVRFRSNAFFATGDPREAEMYGRAADGVDAVFFPCGQFKFCWSPIVHDFFAEFSENFNTEHWGNNSADLRYIEDRGKLFAQDVLKFVASKKYKYNDLIAAIESKHEVMVHCKTALMLNSEMAHRLPYIQACM